MYYMFWNLVIFKIQALIWGYLYDVRLLKYYGVGGYVLNSCMGCISIDYFYTNTFL